MLKKNSQVTIENQLQWKKMSIQTWTANNIIRVYFWLLFQCLPSIYNSELSQLNLNSNFEMKGSNYNRFSNFTRTKDPE